MEIRILGPLTVYQDGRNVPVSSSKLRAVLAYLVIHARRLVTVDALVGELWGDDPPPSAVNTVQTYISQLRQLLEPEQRAGARTRLLQSRPGGYLLDIEAAQVDHVRFEDALHDGRLALDGGDVAKAVERLRDGLALWRGPALVNVAGTASAGEAVRLNELHVLALELRIGADLTRGRHEEVIGELRGLVRDHPWRERFAEQLMLALYRAGRQAEALACYREVRNRLAEDLAISPGQQLRELERHILQQHPDLAAAPAIPAHIPASATIENGAVVEGVPPTSLETGSRWTRRHAVFTLSVLATLLVVTIVSIDHRADPSGAAVVAPEIFNEFDLVMRPGIGHDLDVPRGQALVPQAQPLPTPSSLDLYRTSTGQPESENQVSGVDPQNTGDYNPIYLMADTDAPEFCRGLQQRGGGNVKLRSLHVGARVCLRTHGHRWAMLVVRGMPSDRHAPLLVHIVVLTS